MEPICAICKQSDPDMECTPTVHPDWGWEWVHRDCLREWEYEANKAKCSRLNEELFHSGIIC